jgi:hypothetical protein
VGNCDDLVVEPWTIAEITRPPYLLFNRCFLGVIRVSPLARQTPPPYLPLATAVSPCGEVGPSPTRSRSAQRVLLLLQMPASRPHQDGFAGAPLYWPCSWAFPSFFPCIYSSAIVMKMQEQKYFLSGLDIVITKNVQ